MKLTTSQRYTLQFGRVFSSPLHDSACWNNESRSHRGFGFDAHLSVHCHFTFFLKGEV